MSQTTRPEDVHPKYDEFRPENKDEWTEAQIQRYNEAKEAQLETQAQRNRANMAAEQRETLDALRSAVGDDEVATEPVDIGEATVEVKTKISGELEQHFDAIAEEGEKDVPRTDNVRQHLIDAITLLIVDGGESEGYDFGDRRVWEAFYKDEGSEGLYDVFELVSEPARDRREELQKFRNHQGGRAGR